jgi:ABC-type multidrug transport system ATPase subunit
LSVLSAVLDQPTRGLDVGSIEFIHRQAIARRDTGVAILLVSAELDEVLELSDRIAVMYRGRIVDILDGRTADKEEVGLLMATGGRESGIQEQVVEVGHDRARPGRRWSACQCCWLWPWGP